MNVTLNRAEFLSAVKKAAAIASPAAPIAELRGILLEADSAIDTLRLTATNLEVSLEQRIPCKPQDDDAVVINARMLEGMLTLLSGESVTLCRNIGVPEVTVTGGRTTYTVPVFERGSFPKIEILFPEDSTKVTGLPSMARRTVFAAGNNAETPLYKCVNLRFTQDGLEAVCSDGNCMITAKGDNSSTGNADLLVPALSIEKLARMSTEEDEFRVGSTGKNIVFMKENLMFSARLMDGEYVDSERLMNAVQNQFTVLTDMAELRKHLRFILTVEADGKVMLEFKGNSLNFFCEGAYGQSSSELEVIPMTGKPSGKYWFLARKLDACFHALNGTATLGIAQGGMLTLSTENAYYMQPGTRAPTVEEKKPSKKAA